MTVKWPISLEHPVVQLKNTWNGKGMVTGSTILRITLIVFLTMPVSLMINFKHVFLRIVVFWALGMISTFAYHRVYARALLFILSNHTRRWTGHFVTVILNWACISGSILPLNNLSQPLVVQRLDCAIQWIIKISCHWITATKKKLEFSHWEWFRAVFK